jgi:MoaA/NifB/PqqE/SkfB family radical SAM enzyme
MKIFRKEHFGGILYDTATLRFDIIDKLPKDEEIALFIHKELPERNDIISAPIRVYYELLRKCNLFCKHCFVNASRDGAYGEPTESVFQVINELSDDGVIDLRFTGGEPTLRKDLFQILRYAKDKHFSVSLNTNGIYGNPKKIADNLAELDLEQVTISLDGMRENHEYMRGPNTFDRTLEAVALLSERGVKLRFNTVITKRNCSDIPPLIELANKYAQEINFFYMRPIGRAIKQNHISLDFEEHYDSSKVALSLREKYPNLRIMHFEQSFTERSIDSSLTSLKEGYPYGNTTLNLDCFGNLWPHGYTTYQDSRLNLGNLKENALKDIWTKSEKLDNLRSWYTELIKRCEICDVYKRKCAGYNFEMEFAKNLGAIEENPFCISKLEIPHLFPEDNR